MHRSPRLYFETVIRQQFRQLHINHYDTLLLWFLYVVFLRSYEPDLYIVLSDNGQGDREKQRDVRYLNFASTTLLREGKPLVFIDTFEKTVGQIVNEVMRQVRSRKRTMLFQRILNVRHRSASSPSTYLSPRISTQYWM
jgi:hypothetical protein